jgi:hypothetical protein
MTPHVPPAFAEAVLAVMFAPVLLAWLPAAASHGRSETDLYRLAFSYCMCLMPPVIGVCAWFAAWRLHLASGHAGQPAAIAVGVAFAAESLLLFYFLAIGAAMNGSRGSERPKHPYRLPYRCFCSWAYAVVFLNVPLALIVTVVAVLV